MVEPRAEAVSLIDTNEPSKRIHTISNYEITAWSRTSAAHQAKGQNILSMQTRVSRIWV